MTPEFTEFSRLHGYLKTWLQELFPCRNYHTTEFTDTGIVLPEIIQIQERQLARANERLSNGKSFLDRVSHTLFIPFTVSAQTIAAGVLTGVNRLIEPEELERWEEVLKAAISEKLKSIAITTRITDPDELPQYLEQCLASPHSSSFAILHLKLKAGCDIINRLIFAGEHIEILLSDNTSGLPPSWKIQWVGGNQTELWLLAPDIEQDEFNASIGKISRDCTKKNSIFTGCISHFFNANYASSHDMLDQIKQTEMTAHFLGARIFSQRCFESFQKKINLPDLNSILAALERMSFTRKNQAWLLLQTDKPWDTETAFCDLSLERNLESVVFEGNTILVSELFVKQNKPASLPQWADGIINSLRTDNKSIVFAGTSASWQKGYAGAVSVLFALLHAVFIHNGESDTIVAFDDVTLNVMGDEFYSWGDLKGALGLYLEAYKQQKPSRTLLNSLGATLAECGMKTKAVNIFKEAINRFPDDFEGYYNIGGILMEKRLYNEAQDFLEKALNLAPDDLRITLRYLTLLATSGKNKAALDVAEKLTSQTKFSEKLPSSAFRLLGYLRWEANMAWKDIKWALEEAVRRSPVDLEAFLLLSKGYLIFEKDIKTAQMLFEKTASLISSGSNVSKSIKKMLTDAKKIGLKI